MLIPLPFVIIISVISTAIYHAKTPPLDNARTKYCVAETSVANHEVVVGKKISCTRGSMSVQNEVPSLAERKSK